MDNNAVLDGRLSAVHCARGRLGYWAPVRPWRWGLAVMLGQAVALAIAGGDFTLLPLGLILFAVLALPAIAIARAMARVRLRSESS